MRRARRTRYRDAARWTSAAAIAGALSTPAYPQSPELPRRIDSLEALELDETTRIVAIASANSSSEGGDLSGIFVADTRGQIRYHSLADSAQPSTRNDLGLDIARRGNLVPFREPRAMAFSHPFLYFFDGRTDSILSVDVRRDGARAGFVHGIRGTTRYMAVSPDGLVAVIVDQQLRFLNPEKEPILYERSRFDPGGLNFSAWDTLHVLDRARRSLVTIVFKRLEDGSIVFLSETESTKGAIGEADWRAMAVFDGNLYLAHESQVFAYLKSDDVLVPILTVHPDHGKISQLALSRDRLFMLDGDHLDTLPRPEPVDLALEGDAESSQQALLDFYWYLAHRNMLPVREVRARVDYPRLDTFLVEEGVLLAPTSGPEERSIRVLRQARTQSVPVPETAYAAREWSELICWLNSESDPDPCEVDSAFALSTSVKQGLQLRVPHLLVNRRLARETILLEGETIEEYLRRLVFAPEFQSRLTPELILRLNPNFKEVPAEEVFGLRRGSAVLPVEKWAVTATVPASDFSDRDSELWMLARRHRGAALYSRAGFVKQAAKSARATQLDARAFLSTVVTGTLDECETLSSELEKLRSTIHYPAASADETLDWPALAQIGVQIGVLEYASTVLKSHQVFTLNAEQPTWHSARDLALVAEPTPAGSANSETVEDIATYSRDANHGTHVAAILAGRESRCWSGLLPSARVILIDLDDSASVQRAIADAIAVDTKVFNISQEYEGPQEDLLTTITGFPNTLFVAAAGNSTTNLDDAPIVPAPARWGDRHNVIVVAASDWNRSLLPEVSTDEGDLPGSNFGKEHVDLMAPGKDIYSASEQRKYGPASGTSQAAPQVAAAAAVLVDLVGPRLSAGDAKARLIATADWRDDYAGKLWGGMLNFAAAVSYPDRNLLTTITGADLDLVHTFTTGNNPSIVVRNNAFYYEREGQGAVAPRKIPFNNILSLQRRRDSRYRVVLREPGTNHLKVLLDAALEDDGGLFGSNKIQCRTFEVLDPDEGKWGPDEGCKDGLSVRQIEKYVRGGQYHIAWRE